VYQSRKNDPLRGLDHAARSRVRRSVRHGTAVHDPREAPTAAAYADVVAGREQLIPLSVPILLALLGAGAIAVTLGGLRPLWLLPLAVAVVVRPLQRRIRTKALAAAERNRELARETGVHVPERPGPKEAWQGVTSWGVVAVIAVLLAFHLGVGGLIGSEAAPPPPAAVEPDDSPHENAAWYAHATRQCKLAAAAVERLGLPKGATFRAKRYAVRLRAFDAIADGAGFRPDRANGAMIHLYAAIRHERDALALERARKPASTRWQAAAHEAKVSTSLLQALGVDACGPAFR
jgi:hypothetical protein